ncbi:sirohydrochlorin chelatase [Psychromicrobium xiongbiense]|uniref:sirohydrochlorin chelatase n=1 Tax=Psychromicrobium xiongbiense TaxID=3051184 RepID=UPI00255584D3|nr:CbiX/SirB N-terminal domain-containing protein [Psychromicrobium sp. YIM S02556]
MKQPILIACSHGTDNSAGRAAINQLREELRQLRPGLEVREAYVDVQQPALPDVVAGLPEGAPAVVLPLLLTVGYHVLVDVAQAAASRPLTGAAAPLGPDPRLAQVLADRLTEIPGFGPHWSVVLASAGSSRPEAELAMEVTAEFLRASIPNTVRLGFGAGAQPRVPEAVALARAAAADADATGESAPIAVASYLLAPGYFQDQLAKAEADAVAQALLPDRRIAEVALERYDQACQELQELSA